MEGESPGKSLPIDAADATFVMVAVGDQSQECLNAPPAAYDSSTPLLARWPAGKDGDPEA
jgi:hypothetical protein